MKKLLLSLVLIGLAIPTIAFASPTGKNLAGKLAGKDSNPAAKKAQDKKAPKKEEKPDDKMGDEDELDIPGPEDINKINIGGLNKKKKIDPKLKKASELMKALMDHFAKKDYQKAKEVVLELIKMYPKEGVHWYNLACAESRMKNYEIAIKHLKNAVKHGYDGMMHMERDKDLTALHKYEEFKKLLGQREKIHRERADKIFAKLKKKYGPDYIMEIDHERRLIFATNVDRETLEMLKKELTRQTKAMWSGKLFDNKFERYITVVIPKPESVRNMGSVGGYYRPDKAFLVARSIGYVLRHEFTHALHFADIALRQQSHPIWVLEGLATLYESSNYDKNGDLVPTSSMRLWTVKQHLKNKTLFPIKKFLKMDHRAFMSPTTVGLAYAQSRYFMKFIYDQGKLKEWYDEYCANFKEDKTGELAIKKVFKMSLKEFEQKWHAYLKKEKLPMMNAGKNKPFLGIGSQATVDGLEVKRVVKGSGADKAGLKPNDVIVKIDGKRIIERQDLIKITASKKINDVITIRIRRGKEYKDIKVKLGARPKVVTRPKPKFRMRRKAG